MKSIVWRWKALTGYLDLYSIKLLSGKNLIVEDTAKRILVNETFVKHVNTTNENILGRRLWCMAQGDCWWRGERFPHAFTGSRNLARCFDVHAPLLQSFGISNKLKRLGWCKNIYRCKMESAISGYTINLRLLDQDLAEFYRGESAKVNWPWHLLAWPSL